MPVDTDSPAFAALMCAAVAYNRTPQLNRAAVLRQELADAQRENRRLGAELLREGARADRLQARLASFRQRGGPGLGLVEEELRVRAERHSLNYPLPALLPPPAQTACRYAGSTAAAPNSHPAR